MTMKLTFYLKRYERVGKIFNPAYLVLFIFGDIRMATIWFKNNYLSTNK